MSELDELTFGIEIETVGAPRRIVAEAIRNVVGGRLDYLGGGYGAFAVTAEDGRTWKVVFDSSLAASSDSLKAEVVSPVLRYRDLAALQDVARAVRKAGARVNHSCGIHVHVGTDRIPVAAACNLVKMVNKNEDLIFAALNVQEGRKSRYCRPIEPGFMDGLAKARPPTPEELNKLWYGDLNPAPEHYHPSRYNGLNIHNYFYRGTIEFRYFESTLHAGKIKAYVQFVLCLARAAIKASQASGRKRPFNEESGRYDFRVLLNRLGMKGPEFQTARLHLLSNLKGDAAFKNGRPR